VKPFLERYPEEAIAFRQFVKEGRLQIVGGTDTMLDANIPGGESMVRQMLYGKSYFREKLGVDVTTGWALDTFGHNAQMPQLLKLAGYNPAGFNRCSKPKSFRMVMEGIVEPVFPPSILMVTVCLLIP
jgi:hypothetical protein